MAITFQRRGMGLLGAGLLVGLAIISTADAQTAKYKESPLLAEQVKAGKLPAVDLRLPEQPSSFRSRRSANMAACGAVHSWVVRRQQLRPRGVGLAFPLSPDGSKIEPEIAAGAESSADFKTWTILLRKGAKWSDGAPFTADDILFWYKDVVLNKDLTPVLPGWMKNADGSPAVVEKVDDYSVRFSFKEPATLFLTALVAADGGDRTYAAFLPAHYLKKFHAAYASKEDLDKAIQAAGFKTWVELFANRNAPPENVERPTMAAWMATSRVSDPVFTLRRNPYFIGVDKDGNQLPYIDEVRFTYFADVQALNLAAIAGDFDIQERHIQMTNYPVFKEQEKAGKYKVLTWPTFGGADAVLMFNQTYKADPEMGRLMATKDFRIAMSHAINRDQIREIGVPGSWRSPSGCSGSGASVFSGRRIRQEIHRL